MLEEKRGEERERERERERATNFPFLLHPKFLEKKKKNLRIRGSRWVCEARKRRKREKKRQHRATGIPVNLEAGKCLQSSCNHSHNSSSSSTTTASFFSFSSFSFFCLWIREDKEENRACYVVVVVFVVVVNANILLSIFESWIVVP